LPVDPDPPGGRLAERGGHREQARLARAVPAEQPVDLALLEGEGDAVEGGDVAVAQGEVPGFDPTESSDSSRRRIMWRTGVAAASASATIGSTTSVKKVSLRFARSFSCASGLTNMPIPRFLYRTPSSTSCWKALAAVAGLIR